jgi:hypothetical protein
MPFEASPVSFENTSLMTIDYDLVPPFYRSWLSNALQAKRRDDALTQELTSMRDEHAEVAAFQARLIDMYDRDELRNGREKIIDACKTSRDYCERVVAALNLALNSLRQQD